MDWKQELVQTVDEQCSIQLSYNISLYIQINGVFELPDLFEQLCPGDCSGNGVCDQGMN